MTVSQKELASGLQSAVQMIGRGEVAAALQLLDGLARALPPHPDILQIRGVALRRLGRLDEAIDQFRKSLRLHEAQPHVHNNLAGALLAAGRSADAETHFRRAVTLKPDYAEAKYNLALLRLDDDPAAARDLLRGVTTSNPGFAPAWEALSLALGKLDDREGALAAARRAATQAPGSHTALHNLGQAAAAMRDHAGAEDAYRRSVQLQPRSDAGWLGLGSALRAQERNVDAVGAMEQAVVANPANVEAHRVLNELLWQTGQGQRYLQSYAQALAAQPGNDALRAEFASSLVGIMRPDDALSVLEPMRPDSPLAGHVEDIRARALAMMGDHARALAHHATAVKCCPGDTIIVRNGVETMLKAGRHDEALAACEKSLAGAPFDQGLLAMLSTALRLAGDERHHALADFQSLARVFTLDPPPGFSSIEDFNLALAEELRKLHTTRFHPTDQTLRGGTQTFGALFDRSEKLVGLLRVQLEKAIATYIGDMRSDETHPLFNRRRRSFGFSGSWSVRLSVGGFHTNHFHPKGWISSAYYVKVPDEAQDEIGKPGWFKLGETNLDLGTRDQIARHVQPRSGCLVLFPSYFWHGTVPFNTRDERITVAFDVVPVA